jgi:ribosome-binding factor A
METTRQKRIAKIIQMDLAEILQGEVRRNNIRNLIITVSKVTITPDLSLSRVYVSVFPSDKADELIDSLQANTKLIKHEIAQKVRHQLRKMPDLVFYKDDSLDYIEEIDRELKNGHNPIE